MDGVTILDVKVNGSQPARLLVDTGAQTTTFSQSAARRLNLPAIPGADPASLFSGTGRIAALAIGGFVVKDVEFGILKLKNDVWERIHSKNGPVDGSLGLDLISRISIGLDVNPGAECATLWKAGELSAAGAAQWFNAHQIARRVSSGTAAEALERLAGALPAGTITHAQSAGSADSTDSYDIWLPPGGSAVIDGKGYRNPVTSSLLPTEIKVVQHDGRPCTVRGSLNGIPLTMDLDTGSSQLTLPSGLISVIKPLATVSGVSLSAIDATESAIGCIFKTLTIGSHSVSYPYGIASSGRSAYTRRPTAGMGLFTGCKVLLDLPANRVLSARVSPGADAPRQELAALGVFQLDIDGVAHTVIGHGSPAEREGMRDGDILVATAGLPPAQSDEAVLVRPAVEGEAVVLSVRRRGERGTTTYRFAGESAHTWSPTAPIATFPELPRGYTGAKRFPSGGLCFSSDGAITIVRPGGSVLSENGKYTTAYRSTQTKSFTLNLPRERFQIFPAPTEPGKPPFIRQGMGLIWIGGVGWVIGQSGSRLELDGFTVTLHPGPGPTLRD